MSWRGGGLLASGGRESGKLDVILWRFIIHSMAAFFASSALAESSAIGLRRRWRRTPSWPLPSIRPFRQPAAASPARPATAGQANRHLWHAGQEAGTEIIGQLAKAEAAGIQGRPIDRATAASRAAAAIGAVP